MQTLSRPLFLSHGICNIILGFYVAEEGDQAQGRSFGRTRRWKSWSWTFGLSGSSTNWTWNLGNSLRGLAPNFGVLILNTGWWCIWYGSFDPAYFLFPFDLHSAMAQDSKAGEAPPPPQAGLSGPAEGENVPAVTPVPETPKLDWVWR